MKISRNVAYFAAALMAVVALSAHYAAAQTTTTTPTNTTVSNVPIVRVVNISNRGNVQIDGVVTSVNSTGTGTTTPSGTIVVGSWAGEWTINVSSTVKFLRSSGQRSTFGEIQTGDRVQVVGRVTNTNMVINATRILDRSLERRTLIGTVSGTTGNGFTLNITGTAFKGKMVAVQPALSGTVTVSGNGVTGFSGITDGMRVRVTGDLNRTTGTMYAISVTVTNKATSSTTTTQ